VRITRRNILTIFLVAMGTAGVAEPARAQNPETLLPEESAAKAKGLLQQAIAALGGAAYLSARDADCSARLSYFGHSGDLTGYDLIRDIWKFPDKNRTEYSKKSEVIDVYNGSQGWTLDKAGVSEATAVAVADFQEQVKKDMNNLLRYRLKEEGMIFRYGGSDIVDLKQVDWVEIVDSDRRTFRIALDRETRLPIRYTVLTRNPTTRDRTEETTYFSNYHVENGVQTPLQVTHERNGLKIYQVFYYGCKYNSGVGDDLFSRAALDKRWAETPKKKKK
jgi:outer membrane lipoprotein-sorting protein